MDRIPVVRRALLSDRPPLQAAALTLLAIALPTGARWLIDGGQGAAPFATYFPVILVVALFLDWRFAAVTALAHGAIANRLFSPQPVLFYASWRDFLMVALFGLTCAFLIWMGSALRRLIRDLEEARQHEERLNGELLHRARNTLSIISALASTTARHSAPEDFVTAFEGRVDALRRATELLERTEQVPDAHALVERAVAPFRTDDNFDIAGPACAIPEASCVPLVLMLHELCTNAAKHGALSAPGGTVQLTWREERSPRHRVMFHWREQGGPPVPQIRKPGMGSRLLQAQKGIAALERRFEPTGAECEIAIDCD